MGLVPACCHARCVLYLACVRVGVVDVCSKVRDRRLNQSHREHSRLSGSAVEKRPRSRIDKVICGGTSTSAAPVDCYRFGVTPEARNMLARPLHREALVLQTIVSGAVAWVAGPQFIRTQESKDVQSCGGHKHATIM